LTHPDPDTSKRFRSVTSDFPADNWPHLFETAWPAYRDWYYAGGDAARPSYGQCLKQFRRHMPELEGTWQALVEAAGGGDAVARFLSLYCPPAYLTGCTQAVWTGEEPVLVRNYDYSARRLEGTVLRSRWNDRTVIAMSDALWGVLDGINDAGLAVSLAFGGRLNVGPGFGIPVILRYVLEFCENTTEAIDVLKRVPSHMSYNVTVVDREQKFATIYVAPEKPAVVRQVPVATNHQGRIEWPRHAWVTATLERESAVQSILGDVDQTVDGLVAAFLQPPIYNTSFSRGFGTLYTAVYRPLSRSAEYLWPHDYWRFDNENFTPAVTDIRFAPESRVDAADVHQTHTA
jgi:predicted choloylglycine hydrolase